jgi:hypothetical protein
VVEKRGMYRCVKGKDSVGERSCVPVTTLSVGVTVGAPVPLKVKPGYRLIPLLERTDRDLLLEQCSRKCGGEAVPTRFALRTRASHPLSLRSWRGVGCGTHPRSGDAPASQALR